MSIKSAMDADGGVATETMADRLRNVQTETWQRMEWVHDEAEMAWEAYNECLLLRPGQGGSNNQRPGEEGEDKGKGKQVEGAGPGDESGAADLVEKVAQLKTDWGEQELLRAISGAAAVDGDGQGEEKERKGKEAAVKAEEQQQRQQPQPAQTSRAGRSTAAGSSAAAGPSGTRRTTRGRAANKAAAVQID
jgi:hypothetical protein